MKDSRNSSDFNLVQTAILIPVVALAAIVAGAFVGEGLVSAQASGADSTQISSDIDDSFFTSEENAESDQLAQSGGTMEPRSTDDSTANECSSTYLEDDLRIDFDNDPESVLKLQSFLRTFEGYDSVSLTGEFDEATLEAVMSFQTRYAEEILEPWGYQSDEATGYVYITTKKQINEIYCDEQFSLTSAQQQEIREYREMLNEWRAQGASFETPNYLAEYYGDATPPVSSDTDDRDDTDDSITTDDDTVTTSTSTATTTDDDDDRNFFQRLFGIGGDDADTATSAGTSTDDAEAPTTDTDEATTTDTDDVATTSATATTATGSIDGIASGVYNGLNSILNFLLSPTFLLIVLVVLILLLIATIIEGNDEEAVGEDEGVDPWAEYDETQEPEDTDEEADTSDTATEDREAPTPPTESEESATDTDERKGGTDETQEDLKNSDTKQS